ncbi:MAG: transketolase [Gammaproteobacteria bacterium]|nr:transketolase [Gammaproteobacteria bacterium]
MNPSLKIASAIRALSVDATSHANSGHPGMPLGMADIAAVLWQDFLKFNPENPHWFNRDRFILSNGHGSMLQYALLHLFGFKLSLNDIKAFRTLHSKTPGHPERNHTPGIEVTTGPLSQGLANAVGMALAEKQLALQFNQEQSIIIDHHTYVFLGDGCLMEGLSHETASFAGEYQLNKLIAFYDCNGITIDGDAPKQIIKETIARFAAYGWYIQEIDGHDHDAIHQAITLAKAQSEQPSLIICHTIIGLGSTENNWVNICHEYARSYPKAYEELLRRMNGDMPNDWHTIQINLFEHALSMKQPIASRQSSQICLNELITKFPELIGGSADLTPSNNTKTNHSENIGPHHLGNYIHYGVREFGMSAIMNGLSAHGGFIPYGGTFLVFADYAKNAIRLSAMMELKVIYVLTHDSIALGEDGPTHQPIEQLAMLRYTPKLNVWRPATPLEMAVSWTEALKYPGASCLILSRQNLDAHEESLSMSDHIAKGAYIAFEYGSNPELILMASGSELGLAIHAAKELIAIDKLSVRVVSMPNPTVFTRQSSAYQEQVLPNQQRRRIAIEASAKDYWYQFVGLDGAIIGMSDFGVSAPGEDARKYFGFDVQSILFTCRNLLTKN